MSSNFVCILLVIIYFQYAVAKNIKHSLTFVIDDTYSMGEDIQQLIDGFDSYDTVIKNYTSNIENFVLVTFNDVKGGDPGVQVKASTGEVDEFKTALANISAHGGGDCPEYSMAGIKRAIEESLPGSNIYVFTDATAKDYMLYQEVEKIAVEKLCQIVFVLTEPQVSKCAIIPSSPDYIVYNELAVATSGEVFNLKKQEVGNIMQHVIWTITGQNRTLDDLSNEESTYTATLPPLEMDGEQTPPPLTSGIENETNNYYYSYAMPQTVECVITQTDQQKDEYDIYAEYLASELRNIEREQAVLQAKLFINYLIIKARMGELDIPSPPLYNSGGYPNYAYNTGSQPAPTPKPINPYGPDYEYYSGSQPAPTPKLNNPHRPNYGYNTGSQEKPTPKRFIPY